ncbi:MAG TPA: haloalkane dehalogenase [Candidatus Binataceae bacterium]|nr:haloalkane dehalogenase [Candidatus Binataceae bacterium]
MKLLTPTNEELSGLRADPLLWEQELDLQPNLAESIERSLGKRSGRVYWRSPHDHLYALELADLGRGRPSMALVYGMWDRYEPRPPEHEIDKDLIGFGVWFADQADGLDPSNLKRVLAHDRRQPSWPEGSVLRTPLEAFGELPDFPYEPRFAEVEGLQMAYVEIGEGAPLLLLHGEPTWGFLYRRMIPVLAKIGRVVVPDLIGFGRSDKPVPDNAYSYRSHARWLRQFIEQLNLESVTLVCQDWGGLLGLRVLSQIPERFSRLVAMNTAFPDGSELGAGFMRWRHYVQRLHELDAGSIVQRTLRRRQLSEAEAKAYRAPFPTADYQTGALTFPRLVPTHPDHPGAYENRVAIERLRKLDLPVLLPWGVADPVLGHLEPRMKAIFPNARSITVADAGHFIQEDAGEEVAQQISAWLDRSLTGRPEDSSR